MKRLSLLLDDITYIRSALNSDAYDPVQLGILGETAGANGLTCTYLGNDRGFRERDLRVLREIRKTFLNLRIPIEQEAVRLAMSLMPDMVTFIDNKGASPRAASAIDPAIQTESLSQALPDLQANNISISVLIQPEINDLKQISKLPVDYIEFDATTYTSAPDINIEMVSLDKLKSSAMAASKLGLGINCSGGIRYDHIPALAQIPNLEDITVGGQFIQRALWVGIERAVNEALQLIRHWGTE